MIRNLSVSDIDELRQLADLAATEGFRFLRRFVSALDSGSAALDSPGEFFLGYIMHGEIVGIGGVTPDPYLEHPPPVGSGIFTYDPTIAANQWVAAFFARSRPGRSWSIPR